MIKINSDDTQISIFKAPEFPVLRDEGSKNVLLHGSA